MTSRALSRESAPLYGLANVPQTSSGVTFHRSGDVSSRVFEPVDFDTSSVINYIYKIAQTSYIRHTCEPWVSFHLSSILSFSHQALNPLGRASTERFIAQGYLLKLPIDLLIAYWPVYIF